MNLRAMDLLGLFAQELELCAISSGDQVTILCEPSSRTDYVEATFGAARQLGARPAVITVPGGQTESMPSVKTGAGEGLAAVTESPAIARVLGDSVLVVDLTVEGMIHGEIRDRVLAAGSRVLFVADPPEVLERNLPTPEDKIRCIEGVDRLSVGHVMEVTSGAGTHLRCDLKDSHPGFQCGFVDEPGRWDHWPSTMVACWPSNSNGTIVIDTGDVVFPFKRYITEPVSLEIEDGKIVEVSGRSDAQFLKSYLDDGKDPNAHCLSHMGWGLMKTADWFATSVYNRESIMGMDGRAFRGNFLFSTGPNPFLNRRSPFHLDIPLRGCDVSVDGSQVVSRGDLVDN